MKTRLLRRASAGALALTLIGATAAFADNIYNTIDATIDSTLETMSLTAGGSNGSTTLKVEATGTTNQPADGKSGCNLTGQTTLVVAVSSDDATVATISPSTLTFDSCSAVRALTVTPLKAGTANVTLSLMSNNSGGSFDLTPASFVVNVAAATVTNTAPTKPGSPVASQNPTQGVFGLTWAASTDAEGTPFTYTLEGSHNSGAFGPLAAGITTHSYSFTSANQPSEGTWVYRVKAVETSAAPLSSDWSDSSAAVLVDRTKPTVSCDPEKSKVVLNDPNAAIGWKASDDFTGVVGAEEGTIAVDASTGGPNSATISAGTAVDKAGNESDSVACSYTVTYVLDGFLQPINDTAHDKAVLGMSIFKAGSTVPVKFQLKDANESVVQASAAPAWRDPVSVSCSLVGGETETALTTSATAGSTFRWDAISQQYIYNWSTKNLGANTCWKIGVVLNDGSEQTVIIGLKK